MAAATAQFTTFSMTGTTATVTVSWTIDAAYASVNDIVQLVDSNNTVAYWFYTSSKLQQPGPVVSPSGTKACPIPKSYTPKGGFQAIIRPGGSLNGPTGRSVAWPVTLWKALGL